MKSKKLWTKDFSCITLATVLSAIGGGYDPAGQPACF